VTLSPERLQRLVDIIEPLEYLTLPQRVRRLVRELKKAGAGDEVFAKTANFLAAAQGSSTTVQHYSLQTVKADGIFLITSIEHPSAGTADIIATGSEIGAYPWVHEDAVMDAWCDVETSEDVRGLPWPLVLQPQSVFSVDVTGTGLTIVGLTLHGFIVDNAVAEAFKAAGQLYVEGFNVTQVAAANMQAAVTPRVQSLHKECTHIVAKETLGGDTVRGNVRLRVKGVDLNPKQTSNGGAVLPPQWWHKPGAQANISVAPGDTWELEPRYTSAGGAGTAKLQVTALGRRVIGDC
jgi:hypothetical protein